MRASGRDLSISGRLLSTDRCPAIQIDGLFLLFSHLDPATFRPARKNRKYNRAISVDGGVVVWGEAWSLSGSWLVRARAFRGGPCRDESVSGRRWAEGGR